jgi:leucyl-tRNA synthetase
LVHRTIRKVTDDIDGRFHFNTAIAAIMELVNAIYAFEDKERHAGAVREGLETVVRLLSPFVPHVAEELWSALGHEGGLEKAGWPAWEEAALVEDEKMLVVQINGKVRGKITVSASADDAAIRAIALADSNVERFLVGKKVEKILVVPGRLVSIVVT